jgi:chromosome segregation ATPase
VSDDPGRIIYELEQKLKTANATISNQSADIARLRAEGAAAIERLQTEWQSQFIAAQQLRSENERLQAEIERLRGELQQSEARNTADAEAAEYAARLEGLLDNSREALRELQEDHTAMDNRAEGARLAYLAVIKALWEMRR